MASVGAGIIDHGCTGGVEHHSFQFTEAAGGFIFEGFLAGLFGEGSVQITDVEDETMQPVNNYRC